MIAPPSEAITQVGSGQEVDSLLRVSPMMAPPSDTNLRVGSGLRVDSLLRIIPMAASLIK